MQIGSVKKALRLKGKEDEYIKINKIFKNLENIDIIDLITSKEDIFSNREETEEILSYINLIFFDKIKENPRYIKCIENIEETKDRIIKNCNYDMTIDNFIVTVWEEINGKYYRG